MEEAYEVVEAVETGGEPNMPLLREGHGRRAATGGVPTLMCGKPAGLRHRAGG